MAHILEGDWKSFVVNSNTGEPGSDQTFHLVINAAGDLQSGSTHGGNAVTGKATTAGDPPKHSIKIDKAAPFKKYRGYLLVNGPQMILVGFANRNPNADGLAEATTDEEKAALFDQQQEVWIATKP